jgi:hypothetical protein
MPWTSAALTPEWYRVSTIWKAVPNVSLFAT